MFKTYFNPILASFVLVLVLSGCSPLLKFAKDENYNVKDVQEREALQNTKYLFDQMDGIDSALYLSKKDFTSLINKTFDKFTQHFIKLDAPDFSEVSFESIQLHLGNQNIRSEIKFSFEVDALKRKIFGHLSANHKLQAGTNAFFLDTNFNEIILDHIEEFKSLKENSQNKKIIAASVKSFMHILNIEIINMPLQIPVDMNILSNINGKDIASSPDYKLHSARAVNMQTKMKIYLPYISEDGVAFFGASKLNPVKKKVQTQELSVLREDLSEKIDLSLSENMGISLNTLQKYSSYYIGKKYLANQMNLSLKAMDLRMINKFFMKIDEKEKGLKKDIYFFNKDNLPSCDEVKRDCSKLLHSCDQQCERRFGIQRCEQCDKITNPFEQVRCMSKIEACKSKEDLYTYECHKRENKCEADNNAVLISCEIKNLEYIEICKEKKERLQFTDDEILLAQLNLNFDIDNSYAVQRIKQIIFDKELNSLEVIRDVHTSVDSRLQFNLSNNQNNDLNCSLEMDEALLIHSQIDQVKEKKELPLFTQRTPDGRMLIKAISKKNFLTSTLNNSPYDTLMKTKGFNLQCQYQGIPMDPITAEKLLTKRDIPYGLNVMFGAVELQFEEELTFVISPVKLGTDILLYPTMEANAIGFSHQAHFY